MQAFHADGMNAVSQNDFAAAPTDVEDQSPVRRGAQGEAHPPVDQAGLFLTGNDFDRMAEHLPGLFEEVDGTETAAQRVGADGADVLRRDVTQAVAESAQCLQRPLLGLGRDGSVGP